MVIYPYYREACTVEGSISEREVEKIYKQIAYYAGYAYEGLAGDVGAVEAKKLVHGVVASMLFHRFRGFSYGEPRARLYAQWFKYYEAGYDDVVYTSGGTTIYVVGNKAIKAFTHYDDDEGKYVTTYDFVKSAQRVPANLKV